MMRCNLCGGMDFSSFRGRPCERCLNCGSLARHRFQAIVLQRLFFDRKRPFRKTVHVAPENSLVSLARAISKRHITLDVDRGKDVNIHASLTDLPFADGEVDLMLASHVLEHILDVELALKEICRVLCSGGIALVEVPVVRGSPTLQINPSSNRDGHHWIPGDDWTTRYNAFMLHQYDPLEYDLRSYAILGRGSPVSILEKSIGITN